jgi:alcohol dehydrogenase class IV
MLSRLTRVAEVRRWSDFASNTDSADLIHGLRIIDEFRPDLVLGVGGGSAMDMAKLLCAFQGVTAEDRLHELIRSGTEITSRTSRMVLAPTTSGSGSEATHFAVVYIGEEKFSTAGPVLRPDAVILDPALTLSSSRYQRATSGIDAVAQAIESLWAVAATDESRRWAQQALRLLLPAIEMYVNRPDDIAARAMAIGSHLAGRAIDISKTTAAHALSYGITRRYGVSHGHAVALTLGAFIELHGRAVPEQLQPSVSAAAHAKAMQMVLESLGGLSPREARKRFTALSEAIGLELQPSKVGIDIGRDVEEVVRAVNIERLSNNPLSMSNAQLMDAMVAMIMKGNGQDG